MQLMVMPLLAETPKFVGSYVYSSIVRDGTSDPQIGTGASVSITKEHSVYMVSIYKEINPPGKVLQFTVPATLVESQLQFAFTGGWGGKGVGSVSFDTLGILKVQFDLTSKHSDLTPNIVDFFYADQEYLRKGERTLNTFNALAEKYYTLKKYNEAARILDLVTNAYPTNEKAMGNYSITLIKLGKYSHAIGVAKRLLSITNKNSVKVSSYYNIGLAYEKQKKNDLAVQFFKKSNALKN